MISIVIICKDEPSLDETLGDVELQAEKFGASCEIVVVDASSDRLDHIRQRHAARVRWIEFEQPAGVRVSIPQQRNAGVRAARGDVVVFTDAGCRPARGWLSNLVAPLLEDEVVTAGLTLSTSARAGLYDDSARKAAQEPYVSECSTINVGFRRAVFDVVGGFDESFAYGSDVDFSWRLVDAGYRIRCVPDAQVRHDWGGWRRQLRRSYFYGRARVRLYQKHHARLKRVLRENPMVVVYPAFILGLPLIFFFPFYPAVLLIPAWRNRSNGPLRVLVDHLVYGAGILVGLVSR